MTRLLALAAVAALPLVAAPVHAGTKYQTNLVPELAGSTPGFSANGSSIKIDDKLSIKGKIKGVVDALGDKVTTDSVDSNDDYVVQIDLAIDASHAAGAVFIHFDVKKGNATFATSLVGNPLLAGATAGMGVTVHRIEVRNANGEVLGTGGFALK